MRVLDLTDVELKQLYRSDNLELRQALSLRLTHPYYGFRPRPDDPADYEEQNYYVDSGYRYDPRAQRPGSLKRGLFIYDDPALKFKICLGGTGSGKTVGAAFKTARHVLEVPPPEPAIKFWVISHTMEQVCGVCWTEKLKRMIPEEEIFGISYVDKRRGWPSEVALKHPQDHTKIGWLLQFKSYEQGLSGLVGASIGGYWLNEEVPYPLVAEVQGRTREYDSPGWADFTPIECRDPEWPKRYNSPPQFWRFYHLNSKRNFYNAPDWYESQLAHWSEDIVELRTIGKFTSLQGAVYKEFREHVHVITWDDFRKLTGQHFIPRDWRKIRGIDLGYYDPFVCLWCAKDHDGTWFIYDEHCRSETGVEEHAKEIRWRGKDSRSHRQDWDPSEPWYGQTYCDHSPMLHFELSQKGVVTSPAKKGPGSVNQGIEYIRSLMKQGKDGKPRLYILKDCRNLIREIPGYRWSEGTAKRNAKDEPLDVNNHALDALRYALFSDYIAHMPMKSTGFKKRPNYKRGGVLIPGSR